MDVLDVLEVVLWLLLWSFGHELLLWSFGHELLPVAVVVVGIAFWLVPILASSSSS